MNFFENLVASLPTILKNRFERAKNIMHSPTYHPEGSVYNHIKIVVERCTQYNDPVMVAAALLHDICKVDTAAINPKTGYNSFIGHEDVAAKLIRNNSEIQVWISNYCGIENLDKVVGIVANHMKIHQLSEMKVSKQQKYIAEWTEQGIFEYLVMHSAADNMLVEFDCENYRNLAKFVK
jgi:hypothetical protein